MAYLPGSLLLLIRLTAGLLAWLIVAYWPGYLRHTGQAYWCGLFAWFFVAS
jgi:hypothetical protein